MVTTSEYKSASKSYRMMNISIILFVFIIGITIGLYFYNSNLESNLKKLEEEIHGVENKVENLNKDEEVKLFILTNSNKEYLEDYKYLSQVPEFINNLKELSKKYKITFKGFSYSNGQITSQASVGIGSSEEEKNSKLAFEKTRDFLEYFRKEDVENETKNIFSLGFINSFTGQDEINFGVKFDLK